MNPLRALTHLPRRLWQAAREAWAAADTAVASTWAGWDEEEGS